MIVFQSHGLLDLRCIRTFGMSAKEDEETAIGQFGTGLKYSIAVALRHGARLEIWLGTTRYYFSKRPVEMRGKSFEQVILVHPDGREEELSFATSLGKNWQPWMILRELHSNVLDEGGRSFLHRQNTPVDAREGETNIVLFHMDHLWNEMDSMFIDPAEETQILSNSQVTIYEGRTNHIYCKGVRVYDAANELGFKYNLKNATLTEDRTLRAVYSTQYSIGQSIIGSNNRSLIENMLRVGTHDEASWPSVSIPEESLADEILMELGTVNALREAYDSTYQQRLRNQPLKSVEWPEFYTRKLERAKKFLAAAGIKVEYPIHLTGMLRTADTLALADLKNNEIWLSQRLMEQGLKQIVTTLLEEWLHLDTGLQDCTYAMQSHLFDRLVTEMELRLGEPL